MVQKFNGSADQVSRFFSAFSDEKPILSGSKKTLFTVRR